MKDVELLEENWWLIHCWNDCDLENGVWQLDILMTHECLDKGHGVCTFLSVACRLSNNRVLTQPLIELYPKEWQFIHEEVARQAALGR